MNTTQIHIIDVREETNVVTMMNDYETFIKSVALVNFDLAADSFTDMYNDDVLENTVPSKANIATIAKDLFCPIMTEHLNPIQAAVNRDVCAELDRLVADSKFLMLCDQSQVIRATGVYTLFSFRFFKVNN